MNANKSPLFLFFPGNFAGSSIKLFGEIFAFLSGGVRCFGSKYGAAVFSKLESHGIFGRVGGGWTRLWFVVIVFEIDDFEFFEVLVLLFLTAMTILSVAVRLMHGIMIVFDSRSCEPIFNGLTNLALFFCECYLGRWLQAGTAFDWLTFGRV